MEYRQARPRELAVVRLQSAGALRDITPVSYRINLVLYDVVRHLRRDGELRH